MANKKKVFNLEFPSWCPKLTIFGYRFSRVEDYPVRVASLQHLVSFSVEFNIQSNTGHHAVTAEVEIPRPEEPAVLDWPEANSTALKDILLLLSLFSGRDVFLMDEKNGGTVLLGDPRVYQWGGVLRCAIPNRPLPEDARGDTGFEETLNRIYSLLRSDVWQQTYHQGTFLFLAQQAFRRQPLEAAFVQCWTIWEHLYTILSVDDLGNLAPRQANGLEQITFLLGRYAADGNSRTHYRLESLGRLKGRLAQYGRFSPMPGNDHHDAVLFIRLTEFLIAKILGL